MSTSPNKGHRINELVDVLLDESLDSSQRKQLEQLVCSNDEARRQFVRLMYQAAGIPDALAARESGESIADSALPDQASDDVLPKIEVEPASLSRRTKRYDSIHPQRHKIRFNAMTAVLTALAWVGFSYFLWSSTTPDDSRPKSTGEDFNFVAYISDVYEHVWAEEMRPMAPNSSMAAGERLQLVEGLIEITFFDGAVVVLEAPVEFVVDSSGAGMLEVGKLAATVSPGANGFQITTPTTTIIDLGTAFGVKVEPSGQSDVIVFDGRVEMVAIGADHHTAARKILSAGQMARAVADETGHVVVHTDGFEVPMTDQFVRVMPKAAAITYVDATPINTTVNGATLDFTAGTGNVGVENGVGDGLWSLRTSAVNGDNVFTLYKDENGVSDTLNTTVSGLASGTYNVYAYFWANDDFPADHVIAWDIKANLNGDTLLDVQAGDAGTVVSSAQTFVTAPTETVFNSARLWAVDLGEFTGTEFTVNVNAGTVGNDSTSRTWFDGVGYESCVNPAYGRPIRESQPAAQSLPEENGQATFQ